MTDLTSQQAILSDGDSGYDYESPSTKSLDSDLFDYEQENGHTYHAYKAGKYLLPNVSTLFWPLNQGTLCISNQYQDDQEQERMNILHGVLQLVFEQLFFAPIAEPTSILDIGTGTGAWAIDVADKYPCALVVATDLSPIQPISVPPNLEFQIADLEDGWDMDNRHDLVHTRNMNISIKSWDEFYDKAYRTLRPGGWVENQEFDLAFKSDDDSVNNDGPNATWCRLINEGLFKVDASGRLNPEQMRKQMKVSGFINCSIKSVKVPIGGWPKDKRLKCAGALFRKSILEGISGIGVRLFTKELGWSPQEMEILVMGVRTELKQKNVHAYCQYYVVCGQKPPDNKTS